MRSIILKKETSISNGSRVGEPGMVHMPARAREITMPPRITKFKIKKYPLHALTLYLLRVAVYSEYEGIYTVYQTQDISDG